MYACVCTQWYVGIFEEMVDTIQTKDGTVAINPDSMRVSMRSVRRGKSKMILTPVLLASHVLFVLSRFTRERKLESSETLLT